ncbi:MAG: valine--tRNA ligase [Candidatus Scalindua sp. AMX11]|nr:MAG: valine--tRNA ligase [Candidatus Scalindua sp.]NOG85089.1 valine--tRNA ligase [Planctomycetota bacterium]RZV69327.1 MAG: valine--tRNA ligase [Candidatus Scalindua sp. SCAELEC01]TDE66763.1 MAG: valine--tRNA ligase [Candidatus Scalindua sp. AMX11]GJQ58074.1 MAG: valine--tRNA ligase [Candidatus Scalindua sp.]
MELPTKYNPKEIEDKWYSFWEKGGFFHRVPDTEKKPYSIVIPPPNVTGVLHMGHALNTILQDILIRWRRMQGYNTVWLPGTDHAGIATQNVVERELLKKGLNREQIGREKFIEKVWDWKSEYGSEILKQLRKLGSSCDWERERFTMDDGLSKAVREAFVVLYEKGLIYKGKYIINWCPRCLTALSDDEVEHEDHEGHLWYIRYPFRDSPHLFFTIATTRPETMLGDVAVAVNPNDERYKEMIGEILTLPVVGREIPIIADESVDPEFGTGAVKITPAHDQNDFEIGQRHKLESILIMNEDGTMSGDVPDYKGMDRFECREALVEELKEEKHIIKVEPHSHPVGHCYRCRTVTEPYLSDQWFIKMKPLAKAAIEAHDKGLVTFYPERWTKVYLSWLENVRDWCISRQIWWGHRIPAWHCKGCGETHIRSEKVEKCSKCGNSELVQDEDVLDTWFSSALWPFSTMGWPDKTEELQYYYPTSTLVTDRGIIYFWVARMVMMGLELNGEVPFRDVYIHGTILDDLGRKMSKSLGNGIDPLLMIDQYGADAIRISIIMLTVEGQDIKLHENRFEMGRNFINKVWNAARFVMMNLTDNDSLGVKIEEDDYEFEDVWILNCLSRVTVTCTSALEKYRFNEAIKSLYEFIWNDFCDWYLEIVKPRLYDSADEKRRIVALKTLTHVLDNILRFLHPFAPFFTEEIWHSVKSLVENNRLIAPETMVNESLMVSPWPDSNLSINVQGSASSLDGVKIHDVTETMQFLQSLVRATRNIRRSMNLPLKQPLEIIFSVHDQETKERLDTHHAFLSQMANLKEIDIGINRKKPDSAASEVVDTVQIFVPLKGLINLETERQKQLDQIKKLESHLAIVRKKLLNKNFIKNAPVHIVAAEKEKELELRGQIEKVKDILDDLQKNISN